MTEVDEFEARRARLKHLWTNLEPRIKGNLVNIWIYKEHLEEVRVEAKELLPLVIELLERLSNTPENERLEEKYHKHAKHLLSLLRHVESTEEWRQEIIEELDHYVLEYADKLHQAIEARKRGHVAPRVDWRDRDIREILQEFERRISERSELNNVLKKEPPQIEAWFLERMNGIPITLDWYRDKKSILLVHIGSPGHEGSQFAYAFIRIRVDVGDIPMDERSGYHWFDDNASSLRTQVTGSGIPMSGRKVKILIKEAQLMRNRRNPTGYDIISSGTIESERGMFG
ncbi:MAG: hypothetical protein Q8R04_06030 [Nanoarchaeota archaeon]|nr:hypothetical protein [Nanoarchaeota archaeon]